MTQQEIAQEFMQGRNCAQCIFTAFAQELGFDPEESDRIAAFFGGGMGMSQTCGAVTGALMAIGFLDGDPEDAAKFRAEFAARNGSCLCRDLIGVDFSDAEQVTRARESGALLERCPALVESACEIVRSVMER